MSNIEREEGPTDPTDPVEETSPTCSTSAGLTPAQIEGMGTPPRSSEPAPVMTSSPVVTPRDSEPGPDVGNREGDPKDMEAVSGRTKEQLPLENEVLEP